MVGHLKLTNEKGAGCLGRLADARRLHVNHNANRQSGKGPLLLQDALCYASRGWSIIPIAPETKKAAIPWKRYQTTRPTDDMLRTWFANGKHDAFAVILGAVSGGLVCRDFDTIESYERWAAAHPDLACTLPTAATARGRHVYCRSGDLRFVDLGDGEYRADTGHYCLLPPSRHPAGHEYRWLIALPDGPLPFIDDVEAAGLLDAASRATECNGVDGDNRGEQSQRRTTEAIEFVEGDSGVSGALCCTTEPRSQGGVTPSIEAAIARSLPHCPRKRNAQILTLARALKAVPELADGPAQLLRSYVERWHRLALPVIGTKPFEETWIDFLRAWPRVKYPLGSEPIRQVFEAAKRAGIPAVATRYEQTPLRLLVALCRQLQREAGAGPFFLACRTAGSLLGVDHGTAWRWLFLLQQDGVLKETEKGSRAKRRASRYRYLGD